MIADEPGVAILLVDDVEANLTALEATLGGLGASFVKARSGEEALRCLLGHEFAVILLDVQMPEMDGFEAAEMIRNREKSRHTPIVFLTAINKTDIHVMRGYSLGAVDYIFKPIVPEVLRSKVGVFVDLFKLRRREQAIAEDLWRKTEELERSNADLAQFAHVAAHDMQEPLRTVIRYLRLLSRRYHEKLDASGREFIDFAVDGALRMQQLIQDLLSYARLDARALRRTPVDFNAVLARAVASVRQSLDETGGEVTSDKLPLVAADETQVARLLQNLLSNAIKFRGEHVPKIHVSADRSPTEWLFQVRDNGIGVGAKDRQRIFAVFERLHGTAEYPGTGIGLAICKRIVENHGGRIWVESAPEGGSVFFFTLPADGSSEALPADTVKRLATPASGREARA